MIGRVFWTLLAAVVIIVGGLGISMVGAQDDTSDTYAHTVDRIETAADTQICFDEVDENVNQITFTGRSTHYGTAFFHYNTERDVYIDTPKLYLSPLVLYTNGSNPLVERLASMGVCTPPGTDVTCPITLDEYNISVTAETPEGIDVIGGPDAASDPPRPRSNLSSFVADDCVRPGLLNNSTSADAPVPAVPIDEPTGQVGDTLDNTTDTVQNATGAVNNSTDIEVNGTADDLAEQVNDTVDRANETTDPVDQVVDETVETVDKTVDAVDETVDATVETVQETADAVNQTVDGGNDSTNETTETTANQTETEDGGDVLSVGAGAELFGLL